MSRPSFWVERARAASDERHRSTGVKAPAGVARLVASDAGPPGFLGALRLAIYVIFGSPLQMLGGLWRRLTDRETPRSRERAERLANSLRPMLSDEARTLVGSFERGLYRRDLARVPPAVAVSMYRSLPAVVAQPADEDDVVAALRFAREEGLAVYPRGVSSSAFGGAVPTTNGLVLDLSAMREIVSIDAGARTVTVQPGVRWGDLARALEEVGLSPMTTPSSRFSTVGGWASTGGIGMESFRYGALPEALVGARAVLADGEVVSLDAGDGRLADLVGTEGQLGVFTELTLTVRPRGAHSGATLLCFDEVEQAAEALKSLVADEHEPSHVAFFDRGHMREEAAVAADRHGRDLGLFEDRHVLLLCFDDEEAEARFVEAFPEADAKGEAALGRQVAARYLWSDRFFPLKGQRLGPSLLASEVVLPVEALAAFARRAGWLGRSFGVDLGLEATIGREGEERAAVVIASFACDRSRRADYMVKLVLVQLLTHLGVRLGGRPYGVGIWNTPFVGRRLGRARLRALRSTKAKVDPEGRLNPRKFFGVRSRFGGLPGLLFVPWIHELGLWAALLLSPVLGALSRALAEPKQHRWDVPEATEDDGGRLLAETAERCTLCGACVSVCPAYVLTRDEQVTGRAKLQLAGTLNKAEDVSQAEAASPFQCFRCGLCEEVCQTRLPLRECYLALERRVEARFGFPEETVRTFVERVDERRDWILRTFGLDLPEWRPDEEAGPGGAEAEGEEASP